MQKIAAFILMVGVLLLSAVSNSVAAGTADSQSAPTSTPAEAPETTNQPPSASEIHEHVAAIRASHLSHDEECEKVQQYLWQQEKMGNLDERYSAYYAQVRDWYHVDGRPYDRLSRIRDYTILEFHSFGSAEMQKDMNLISPQLYWQRLVERQPYLAQRQALKNCILTKGLVQECTAIAVQERLIPSFEEYAAEIDLFLKNGARFKCTENPRD